MTTSKHYGPRGFTGRVGITSSNGEQLYWDAMTFSQNVKDARRGGFTHDTVVLRQQLLDARMAMDAAQCETFIVDYADDWASVTDTEGRVFGTDPANLIHRPTDTLEREARNYLVQEVLDALKANQELTFAWVTVRTPKPTPKPTVKVVGEKYDVLLAGSAFAIDIDKAHLLPQIHDAIEAHKAGEADIETRAAELYSENGESSLPWGSLVNLEQSGWLYAARLGGR